MRSKSKNPWFSLVTPEGPAGVAVWMLGGPGAEERIQSLFVSGGKALPVFPSNQSLGVMKADRAVSDEVLLVCPAGERPGGIFEIHGHGGSQLAAMHRFFFTQSGFEEKPPGSTGVFPGQTRLVSHLQGLATQATTSRVCRAFLHQSRVLPQAFGELIQSCWKQDGPGALGSLSDMESAWKLARRWLDPFRVSVLGPPNAGKSSLLNYLVGKKRAVVSPIPGTTVDVIRVSMALEGWPIELCDTAGVRETPDEVEQRGIDLSFHSAGSSDLVLWLRDGTLPNSQEAPDLDGKSVLEVWTKRDLVSAPTNNLTNNLSVAISTINGEGCQELQAAILARLVGENRGDRLGPAICSEDLAKMAGQVRCLLMEGDFQGAAKRLSWWLESVLDAI